MTSKIFRPLIVLAVAGAACISLAVPANDNMADASVISGSSGSTCGSNVGATSESGEPMLGRSSTMTTTIWWRWTAPTSGRVTFNTVGSSFDTVMGIYSGTTLSSLQEINYDDDGGGDMASRCVAGCTSGETYYICVAGWDGRSGDVSLQWEVKVPLPNLSRFRIDGHQAVVCGVVGATADSFTSRDGFGNTRCLVDSRIVDAEKTSGWNDDTYWCAALSEMDMLVWLGWAQEAGYSSVDSLADQFRQNPGWLGAKPASQGEYPARGMYVGAFDWYASNIGGFQAYSEGFSLDTVSAAIDGGDGLVQIYVTCDCTLQPWAGLTGRIGHALVCCGYAYDDSLPKSDPNSLKGLFIIDPDNDQETNGGAGSAPNSISYRPVTWDAACECYEVASVWGGRDGTIGLRDECTVLYAKPGYEPVGIDVSGGGNPQPDPPPGPVQPDPQPGELAFGAGLVSTFETDCGTATVAGVANLTWEMFSGNDGYDSMCFVDSRIVDAEKDAVLNNDDFWCGAMTDMDMMFAQGWLPTDYVSVDDVVAEFAKYGESDLRWTDNYDSFSPMWSEVWEGQYGYQDEAYYTGMFRWARDTTSASDILSYVTTGTVDSGFLSVLQSAFPEKLLHLSVLFPSSNAHRVWGGVAVSHSVMCCGYVSDGATLRGLFVIDPDNDQYVSGGGASAPNSIAYCPVSWNGRSYEIAGIWGETGTIMSDYVALARKSGVTPIGQVSAPVLNPAEDKTFVSSQSVQCSCATGGATIRFTRDDTAVTESSPVWEDLTLTTTTVVRVKAFKAGMTASDEVRRVYTLEGCSLPKVETPVLDPASNVTFATSLAVKCTCPTEGATIRFATNETDVITESFPVWADLAVTTTMVIRVKAFKANMQASDEVKCVYTLDPEGGEKGKSSLWTDPVVSVGRNDELEATAATTYTGWLHDSKGNVTASFTMKVNRANKAGIAKATLTVTDLRTGQKTKYTGNYNVEDGAFEDGQLEDLEVGEDGVVGRIGKETLTGGRLVNKTEAASVDGVYKNRIFAFAFENTAGKNVKGAATFTVKFSGKGKAKISGTLMDGTKVSTSAQLIVGDKACALPISFTKKGKANFGIVLWFNEKKAGFKEATGLTECTLGDGITDVKVNFVGCDEVDMTTPKAKALEVDGKKVADIAANGTKWAATAAKGFEESKPKLSYAAKKGTFTGSYKATVKGAAKSVSAKITGVWLGKTGVGTAVMKVNKATTAYPVIVK